VPYRVDIKGTSDGAFDRLVELGALDVEVSEDAIAALIPDAVAPGAVAAALNIDDMQVSPATGRDLGSVWVLRTRPIQIGALRIVPAHLDAEPGALKLTDAPAFGTGLHPTTMLCLEALAETMASAPPESVLDVGTGSGVLALAALRHGATRALGIDTDQKALSVAAENARINGLEDRLDLALGGPETITGTWRLVVANVLAAPLIEMAPALVQRVGRHGELVLSGIPLSVEYEVERIYRNLGMRQVRVTSRAGWVALVLRSSW
jgi:ribosomal protein L11 methyltransferase